MNKIITFFLILTSCISLSQTKASGIITDKNKEPIPYCSLQFKGSTEGVVSNEDGTFYIESPKLWNEIERTRYAF
jgi:hypothetical protein